MRITDPEARLLAIGTDFAPISFEAIEYNLWRMRMTNLANQPAADETIRQMEKEDE